MNVPVLPKRGFHTYRDEQDEKRADHILLILNSDVNGIVSL